MGRFLSLDPLAAEFPEWSDYNYVLGNPVMLIDPDGKAPDWYPEYDKKTGTFNLIAEKGDNAESLYKWFGGANGHYTKTEVAKLYAGLDTKTNKLEVTDNFYFSSFKSSFEINQDNFNCFASVYCGVNNYSKESWSNISEKSEGDDKTFKKKMGIPNPIRDIPYEKSKFEGTSYILGLTNLENAVPFETIFVYYQRNDMGEKNGIIDHVALYAGTNKSGEPLIYTKDSYNSQVQILQLKDYSPNYGNGRVDEIYQIKK